MLDTPSSVKIAEKEPFLDTRSLLKEKIDNNLQDLPHFLQEMLIESVDAGCLDEMLIIVSIMKAFVHKRRALSINFNNPINYDNLNISNMDHQYEIMAIVQSCEPLMQLIYFINLFIEEITQSSDKEVKSEETPYDIIKQEWKALLISLSRYASFSHKLSPEFVQRIKDIIIRHMFPMYGYSLDPNKREIFPVSLQGSAVCLPNKNLNRRNPFMVAFLAQKNGELIPCFHSIFSQEDMLRLFPTAKINKGRTEMNLEHEGENIKIPLLQGDPSIKVQTIDEPRLSKNAKKILKLLQKTGYIPSAVGPHQIRVPTEVLHIIFRVLYEAWLHHFQGDQAKVENALEKGENLGGYIKLKKPIWTQEDISNIAKLSPTKIVILEEIYSLEYIFRNQSLQACITLHREQAEKIAEYIPLEIALKVIPLVWKVYGEKKGQIQYVIFDSLDEALRQFKK